MRVEVVEIPIKFPSLNDYAKALRKHYLRGADMKREVQADTCVFIKRIKKFDKPVFLKFHWVEPNRKRDLDNIASSKKFVLDALVNQDILEDDGPDYVIGFQDTFEYGDDYKLVLTIEER